MRRIWPTLAVVALIFLTECSRKGSDTALIDRYLRLAVGLGQRDPDSLDFYSGPQHLVASAIKEPPKLREIAIEASALQQELSKSGFEPDRNSALTAQLQSVNLRVRELAGKMATFDFESRTYFGITAPEDTRAKERASIRAEIATLIGPGAAQYSKYDAKYLVPVKKVPAVMQAALKVCREKTLARVSMPLGENVEIDYVVHKPWSAFSRYEGNARSVIQVNLEYPLTVNRILDLACHEGYPGHHVYNTLRDQAVVQQRGEREGMVQLTFSPQSFVSEAAASYAPEMVLDEPERVRIERDVLFPIVGLGKADASRYVRVQRLVERLHTAEPGIAREYLDGRLEFARAADALERETLMEHGETMLLYLNEYRSYMLTYTVGRDAVQEWVDGAGKSPEMRWEKYLQLIRIPNVKLRGTN
jgi:hypothetical protein